MHLGVPVKGTNTKKKEMIRGISVANLSKLFWLFCCQFFLTPQINSVHIWDMNAQKMRIHAHSHFVIFFCKGLAIKFVSHPPPKRLSRIVLSLPFFAVSKFYMRHLVTISVVSYLAEVRSLSNCGNRKPSSPWCIWVLSNTPGISKPMKPWRCECQNKHLGRIPNSSEVPGTETTLKTCRHHVFRKIGHT